MTGVENWHLFSSALLPSPALGRLTGWEQPTRNANDTSQLRRMVWCLNWFHLCFFSQANRQTDFLAFISPAHRMQRVFILIQGADSASTLSSYDSRRWCFPDASLQFKPVRLINWRTLPKPDKRHLQAVIRSHCFCRETVLHSEHVYQRARGSQRATCQTQQLHFAVSPIKKCLNICYLKDT